MSGDLDRQYQEYLATVIAKDRDVRAREVEALEELHSLMQSAIDAATFLRNHKVLTFPAESAVFQVGDQTHHIDLPERWNVRITALDDEDSGGRSHQNGFITLMTDGQLGFIEQIRVEVEALPRHLSLSRKATRYSPPSHHFIGFRSLRPEVDGKVWYQAGSRRFLPATIGAGLREGVFWLASNVNSVHYSRGQLLRQPGLRGQVPEAYL